MFRGGLMPDGVGPPPMWREGLMKPVRLDTAMAVGGFLKGLRQGRGWSLRKAADLCGVGSSQLLAWESGKHAPTYDNVQKVLATYQLTLWVGFIGERWDES